MDIYDDGKPEDGGRRGSSTLPDARRRGVDPGTSRPTAYMIHLRLIFCDLVPNTYDAEDTSGVVVNSGVTLDG